MYMLTIIWNLLDDRISLIQVACANMKIAIITTRL